MIRAQLKSCWEYGRREVREAQDEHGRLPHCAELASVEVSNDFAAQSALMQLPHSWQ